MGRVVAVTGANGYIGSHVVQILLDRGYHVRAGAREPHNTERIGHLEEMGSRYPGQLEIMSTVLADKIFLECGVEVADLNA